MSSQQRACHFQQGADDNGIHGPGHAIVNTTECQIVVLDNDRKSTECQNTQAPCSLLSIIRSKPAQNPPGSKKKQTICQQTTCQGKPQCQTDMPSESSRVRGVHS